jgi:hypothetical protein
MILTLMLPKAGAQMSRSSIHRIIAKTGDELRSGTPLMEVRVELDSQQAQDCPPLIFFRLIATERAVLRSLNVAAGALVQVGQTLGIATSSAEESMDGTPTRALRTTSVAIQIDPLSRR